jgi:hemoglobin
MTTQVSLYERLGGPLAIRAMTELFYRKVLSDDLLAPYFYNVDMDRQIAMQTAFLTMALGGPNSYTGRDLRSAHARLGLGAEHFDGVVALLARTLREYGVSDAYIAAAAAVAESVRDDVLNR